ncbi:MAG: sigma-70 family RNA polymerase sigma factor [Lachnospiraceae bacterium]|nr:sigma-70 family RNA polymerase sigma factor [Lachnospiraceae bacterium]
MTVNELAIAAKTDKSLIAELWLSVYRLIRVWAKRYMKECNNRYDLDDLIQSAYFALLRAVEQYPEDCQYSFTTYLYNHCRNEFREVLGIRSSKREPFLKSLDEPINVEDESISLQDTLIDDAATQEYEAVENDIYNEQLRETLKTAMSYLEEKQQKVLHMRFYRNLTYQKAAEELGCSRDYVRTMEGRGLMLSRRGKARRLIKEFDYHNRGLKRTGYMAFKYNMQSSVEDAVLKKLELEEDYILTFANMGR